MWFCIILIPFVAVIAPIFLFLHFKFLVMRLTKMKKQPEEASNDETIGYYIMVFMNLTFLLIVLSIGFFLFYKVPYQFY